MIRKVLSIDGGGRRGIVPATILAHIEKATGRRCHEMFDLITGTSTGGIIALALSLGLSAEGLVQWYKQEGPKIFKRSLGRTLASVGGMLDEKYSSWALEDALKRRFGSSRISEALTSLMVPAYDITARTPFFWKSWLEPNQQMWIVARATSAAPTYFEPLNIDGHYYVDGGVVVNNPAMCAYAEAQRLWPGDPKSIVSVGCGATYGTAIDGKAATGWGALGWVQALLDIFMQGSVATVDYQMQWLEPLDYSRIDARLNGEAMDDASPKAVAQLEAAARKTIEDRPVQMRDLISCLSAV